MEHKYSNETSNISITRHNFAEQMVLGGKISAETLQSIKKPVSKGSLRMHHTLSGDTVALPNFGERLNMFHKYSNETN